MPDGIVVNNLCKTCTKAVLVPLPPCLIFRTASQTWCQPKRVRVEREKEGALGRDEKKRMVGLYANSPVLTAGTPSPIPFRVFLCPILFLLLAGVACGSKKERVRERRARSFLHRLRWLLPCIARAWLLARSPNGEPLAGLTIWWNNPFNIKTFLFIFGSWIFAHVSGEEKDTKKKKCYVEIDVMFITWVRRKENFLTCTCIIIF